MKMRMILGRVITSISRTVSTQAVAVLLLATLLPDTAAVLADDQVYRPAEDFVAAAFDGDPPPAQALWVEAGLRDELTRLFGWQPGIRVRFWQQADRSVWILDEIGKEKPITAGIVVDDGLIEEIEVLVFRESRGWEVKYPFFTDQFNQVALDEHDELNQHIDGITGATLSVGALKRMARVALKLHDETQQTTLARRP